MECADNRDTKIRTIAQDMDFSDLAKFLEGLTRMKEPKKKADNLQKYFNHFRNSFQTNYKSLDPTRANNDSIFSLARIFLPTEDRKRRAYNLKGHTLARVFARTLGLDTKSPDGRRLLEYKNPERSHAAGDLGNVVFTVLGSRCSSMKSPSVAELHTVLDQLARGPEKDVNLESQTKVLQGFIPRLSPVEGKWLARILLKHLGLGLTTKQIFACVHPQAQELYSRTGDLEAVCMQLNDPKARMDDSSLSLFHPFKPMLCARLNSMEATPLKSSRTEPTGLPDPPFLLETKWDGERFQIHYDSLKSGDDRFRYFSRNGFDFTSSFNLTLTPRLEKCVKGSCESFILDGEMMAWKRSTGTFTQKGSNIDVKKMRADNPNHCPAFVAFDVVYFNGESLLKRPLASRMEILMKEKLVVEPEEGVLYLSEQRVAQSKEEVMEALNEAVDDLQEGLVVKDLGSTYEIGKRQGSWLKIKPEFFSEYSLNDLDLIILGGYYTESIRRIARISHFLVGLLDNTQKGKEVFYPVARVGSGCLRLPDMDKLLKDLEPHFVRSENPSFNVPFKGRKRPDFFINPKKSVVVQVKATEILYHETYDLKYTLRFPRIVCVRRDKSWEDIMTLKEFHDIRVAYGGKFAKRNDEVGSSGKKVHHPEKQTSPHACKKRILQEPEETPNKPVTTSTRPASSSKYFTISNSYKTRSSRAAGLSPAKATVKLETNTFGSRVFCVIGSPDWKLSTEQQITSNGGEIVQNPTPDMFAIIAETLSVKVEKFIKKNQFDILKSSWISKCTSSGRIEKILPEDIFGVNPETRQELENDFDTFGDSYRKKVSSIEAKKLFKRIMDENVTDEDNDSGLDDTLELPAQKFTFEDLDPKDAAKLHKFNFLHECKIAFRGEIHPQELFMHKHNILFYGGKFAQDEGDPGVTHVLTWSEDSPTKRKHLSAFVVKPKWLLDCLEQRRLLDELSYMSD